MEQPYSNVGIAEVAARAGVSTATVSRALRGLPNVSTETRERVSQAAADLSYTPSASASSLASGRTRLVGLVTPYVARWFFATLIEGLEERLRAHGYDLLLYNVGELGEDRRRAFDPATMRKRTDALLVLNVPLNDEEAGVLRHMGQPVALVGYRSGGFASVSIDDVATAAQATNHLIELGHTRIAHIGSRPEHGLAFPTPVLRRRGWEQALEAAGLPVDADLHRDGDFTVAGGMTAMSELLALADPPTAVFAGCDEMGIGAMLAARAHGLEVPRDLSVIGIDDHEMARLFDLTTMAQPVREQGEFAAGLLLAALEHTGDDAVVAPREVVLQTRLITRGSTAPKQ